MRPPLLEHQLLIIEFLPPASPRLRQEKRENCHRALERTREAREKQNLMYSKLKPISPTKTPQPKDPATSETRTVEGRRSRRADSEAEETRVNINSFEARLRTLPASGMTTLPLQLTADFNNVGIQTVCVSMSLVSISLQTGPGSTGDYMSQIKRRTQVIQAGREVTQSSAGIYIYIFKW